MEKLQKIKKRTGEVVDFDQHKIMLAIQNAFFATKGTIDEERLRSITHQVISELEFMFAEKESVPSVEQVQDVVERKIMGEGYFDVAKAYIIYRYNHAKEREEKKKEVLKRIDEHQLSVVKRSGAVEPFSIDKVKQSLRYAAKGFEDVIDVEGLAAQCRNEVYDNMPIKEVAMTLVMVTRSFIEIDPAYAKVASRLYLSKLYKDIIGIDVDFARIDDQYRSAFRRNIKKGVDIGKFDKRMMDFDFDVLAEALQPERDDMLLYLGLQRLCDQYFTKNAETKEMLEIPQIFWMRVAMGLAINEQDKNRWAVAFYEMLSTLRFVPSSPTLYHAGMEHAQLSSCFLSTVGDDLNEIFKAYGDSANLLKWAGGMGMDWTPVRATGALVKATGVESQGVVPFLKIMNDVTISINRSGRKRGATCVYLETWHYEIENFLELRKNTGDERRRTHDINTANWIPDLFMKRVREDGDWTLFSPNEVSDLHETFGKAFEEKYVAYERMADEGKIQLWKRIKARDLWKKMLAMLFETGHPWITFKDSSNIRSPQDHVGVVHNSNLCTEITLNNSADETAVCNLGWVNFAQHVTNGTFDETKVAETVRIGMRMLDNVIDANYYPTKETKLSNMRHRPVGLGMGGFHDALYQMNISFDSEAAVEFADSSMEIIAYHAYLTSSELAHERGSYETFKGSKWDRGILPQDTLDLLEVERGEKIPVSRRSVLNWTPVRESIAMHGMRNSNCIAVAPTASTSNVVGAIPSIEPIYKNIYVKSNMSGDFTIVNEYLVEDFKKLGLWSKEMLNKIKFADGNIEHISGIPEHIKEKYKEVFQINPKWLIRAAAHRGKWIDQSQSLNIFFMGSSGKQLSDVYNYAWELGLKTTYYLRTLAASQVEKSTISTVEFGATHKRKKEEDVISAEAVMTEVAMPAERNIRAVTAVDIEIEKGAVPHVSTTEVVDSQDFKEKSKFIGAISIGDSMPEPFIPVCKIDDPSCESCQ